ncbi:unnamed protein product [Calypogeia fissa]
MAASAEESSTATALQNVLQRVQSAVESASRPASNVRVLAVSKTKPTSAIKEVYDAGHRHFGENYVQEITEKALELPNDIQWHFVGHLQSNKAKALVAGVPNLFMVESVDSVKVANHLDRAVAELGRPPLRVLVQVNTSGEESKFGVEPDNCVELSRHVESECAHLVFSGLMTIGMADYTSTPLNFSTLARCREDVCKALDLSSEKCELSMGMSGDFELAIEMGSTNVRIGSTIFGARSYPAKQ